MAGMKSTRRLLLTVRLLILFSLGCGLILPAFQPAALAAPAPQQGAFEQAPCMFELPMGVEEGRDVVCGYVTVPEQHGDPAGPTIQLAVAVIKSKAQEPLRDPLFVAQGGPGGSTIETYAEPLLTTSRLRTDRDIVLWDQRGTLHSAPNLYCSEYDDLIAATIEQDLSDAEEKRLDQETLTACRQRLAQQTNLSAFDSLENAADIESLRQALGYDEINLYGVSYGTLLAQHYMRMFPHSLRSVILDGVVPPQTNFVVNSAQTMNRSFEELFNACQANPDCAEAYPDLKTVFYELVDQLNQEPARIQLTDTETDTTYAQAVIDGDTFMGGVFQMLYAGSLIPALPRMIYDARDGNFDFFSRIFAILLFDRSTSYGMYFSVLCAEDGDFTPQDQDLSGLPEQIVTAEKDTPQDILDSCKIWNVETFGPEVDQPVVSDIPTLVLSGHFDPITPPAYAQTSAATLSNGYAFINPTGGHGQAMEGECEDGLILSFLADPNTEPDASCLSEDPRVAFFTPASVVDAPGLLPVLNLEGFSGVALAVLLLAMLALGSALAIIPLAALVRWLQRRSRRQTAPLGDEFTTGQLEPASPPTRPLLDRLGGWFAMLAGFLLLVFVIALLVVLFQMIAANDNRLFFGLAGSIRPWLVLPVLFALLTVGMLAAAVMAWVRGWWSVWMRLYYSLLSLSALAAAAVLASWGLLFALF